VPDEQGSTEPDTEPGEAEHEAIAVIEPHERRNAQPRSFAAVPDAFEKGRDREQAILTEQGTNLQSKAEERDSVDGTQSPQKEPRRSVVGQLRRIEVVS